MRDLIYQSGGIDTQVAPGMTLPRGQKAVFALRTQGGVEHIGSEFPDQTTVHFRERKGDTWIYEVVFEKLGENRLTVLFDDGRKTYLEFFCSLSPKDLMAKRSAFLTGHQQFRDTGKWYDGLYGVYDMASSGAPTIPTTLTSALRTSSPRTTPSWGKPPSWPPRTPYGRTPGR